MIQQKYSCEHRSQQHTPPEGNRAVDVLSRAMNVSTTFFLFYFEKDKTTPKTK